MKRTRAEMNQTDEVRQKESDVKFPKLFDGKYFKVIEWNNTNKKIVAICRKCEKEVRGQYTSTGNFYKHYR